MNQPAEVGKAAAAMAAKYPNSAATTATRVLAALAKGDLQAAHTVHRELTDTTYKAFTAAFLLDPFKRAGDKASVQTLMADIDAYRTLAINAGLVRAIARRK